MELDNIIAYVHEIGIVKQYCLQVIFEKVNKKFSQLEVLNGSIIKGNFVNQEH